MMRVFDRLTRGVASLCVCVGGRECPIKYTEQYGVRPSGRLVSSKRYLMHFGYVL